MGKKAIYIVCGLGVLASMLQIIGAMFPQHKLGLCAGLGVAQIPFLMFDTYLTAVNIYKPNSMGGTAVEATLDSTVGDKGFLDWLKGNQAVGSHNLEELQFLICTPVTEKLWGALCYGIVAAYTWGIIVIVVLVTNLLCQGIGCYLLYDYCTRKCNPKYREISASLILGSSAVFLFVLFGYFFAGLQNMSQVSPTGAVAVFFSASSASGATKGFIIMVMAVIVQILQGIMVLSFTQNEDGEEVYWDRKEARETGLELQASGPGFGGNPQAGFGMQPGYGNQGMQPQMMQGQMMMQPQMMPGGGMVVMQPMGMPLQQGSPAW